MQSFLSIIKNSRNSALSDLANCAFWFDYRSNRVVVNDGTYDRVYELGSIFSSVGLQSIRRNPVNNRPVYMGADGIGKEAGLNEVYLKSTSMAGTLKFLHDGDAWLLYTVQRRFTATAQAHYVIRTDGLNGASPTTVGTRISAGDSMQIVWKNDTTTQTLAGAAVPLNEWVLCRWKYYGDNSSNNLVMTCKTTVVNRTRTLTPSPNNEEVNTGFFIDTRPSGGGVGADKIGTKLILAYNVTGLSRSQIDTIDASVVAKIKEDPEYSGLIT